MNALQRTAYRPLWLAARRRVERNGLSLNGSPLVLRGLAPDEADAIAGLVGVPRPRPGVALRLSLVALDRALRSSSVGRGLFDVLGEVGGPLIDRRATKAASSKQREQDWLELFNHQAVGRDGRVSGWLEHLRGTGLALRLAGDREAETVRAALDVLFVLSTRDHGHRLAVLAADVTGDAHGLDRGRPAGTLAVHAVAWLSDRGFPQDAADWRRTWGEAGVACDDLSCDVLVLNLPGWPLEPLRLTLRQVTSWEGPARITTPVFACENPAVVAAAADLLGEQSPPIVCLDGMPSTATLAVLDGLVASGADVRYHGDFDWRGLAIAAVLRRKVPATAAWRFRAKDYRTAVGRGLGAVALTGRSTGSPWDPDLALAMADAGVAIFEEQVIDALLSDLYSARATAAPGG